jgi:hypothetical protein
MFKFRVQVFHTDRTRDANGRYRTFRSDVDVVADSDTDAGADDARCAATQIVLAIRADLDPMVLDAQIVI